MSMVEQAENSSRPSIAGEHEIGSFDTCTARRAPLHLDKLDAALNHRGYLKQTGRFSPACFIQR
jgi:hypothetical protein